jgi:ribosomal protein L11 methyltransferase
LGSVPALDLRWSGSQSASLVDHIYALLDDFEVVALHDDEYYDASSVRFESRAFFKTSALRDAAASALHDALGSQGLSVTSVEVADENWAKRSQENLHAIGIGRIVVAPPWATDTTDTKDTKDATDNTDNTDRVLVVIEPSTGFGTGHHETTRLCLTLLQRVPLSGGGCRVIDVGTGSGVLAIAASKLGASSVVAFDEDPQALNNARDNVNRNGVGSSVVVRELDLGSPAFDLEPAGVVMANLTSGVLLKHTRRLRGLVQHGGLLLISGFAPEDLDELVAAFGAVDVQAETEGAWAAALLFFFSGPPAEN